jgi:hypothetical protein
MLGDLDKVREEYYNNEMIEYDIYGVLKNITSVKSEYINISFIPIRIRNKFKSYIDSFLLSRGKKILMFQYGRSSPTSPTLFRTTVMFTLHRYGDFML